MLGFIKNKIPDNHPLRLLFHKIKGVLAALIYWFPADNLIVIGVTGTNGKTTSVNLIANILSESGEKVGMASTINFQVGKDKWVNTTKQTTASPFFLQKLIRRMVKEGCKYLVLEVSSHALIQSRVWGINFDVAAITNLTPEHIEYHGSFEEYKKAKGLLFEEVSSGKRKVDVNKIIVLNADDDNYSYYNQFVADRKLTYGLGAATVFASQVKSRPGGSSFLLHVPNNKIEINLSIPGSFNVYNSLTAASVALALNIPLESIRKGLENSKSVSGRFEKVEAGQDFTVIVDYAHTPESLENLFEMYNKLTQGRLFVVFGATGGGRDKAKRPKMGEAADQNADVIILTNDDPYEEDQMKIINDIAEGINRIEGKNFWKIPDRREAIRLALAMAQEEDAIVLAGKGAEEIMMIDGKKVPWNDKLVVKELLNKAHQVELEEKEWLTID